MDLLHKDQPVVVGRRSVLQSIWTKNVGLRGNGEKGNR